MRKRFVLAFLCALLFAPVAGHGQQCTRRAVLQADADVYRVPPRYVTGAGWQGERVDVLNRGTQVLQCASRSVSFGFSSKDWSQVAYRRGKDWSYGWILAETLRFVSRGPVIGAGLAPALYRVATGEGALGAPDWTIGEAAPPPPPAAEAPAKVVLAAPVNAPTLAEQLALYWPLFAAMLLGMAAKAAVDLIEEWDKALVVRHLRNGVVAFLVSPIVFLGFLNAGEFEGNQQTFLVLLMLSFQNGFFWQTVLKSDVRRKAAS
jgi:hypothetical protein